MEEDSVRVIRTTWERDRERLLRVRTRVFVEEQNVPEEIEVDSHDAEAEHFLALDPTDTPVGTARLLSGGKVGRVAVVEEWRRRGVGSVLMNAVIDRAGEWSPPPGELLLHAQLESIPFYESLGFRCEGPIFDEAGIPHRVMRRG